MQDDAVAGGGGAQAAQAAARLRSWWAAHSSLHVAVNPGGTNEQFGQRWLGPPAGAAVAPTLVGANGDQFRCDGRPFTHTACCYWRVVC